MMFPLSHASEVKSPKPYRKATSPVSAMETAPADPDTNMDEDTTSQLTDASDSVKEEGEDEQDDSELPSTIKTLEVMTKDGDTRAEKKLAKLRDQKKGRNARYKESGARPPSIKNRSRKEQNLFDLKVRAAAGNPKALATLENRLRPEYRRLSMNPKGKAELRKLGNSGDRLARDILDARETKEQTERDKKHSANIRSLAKDAQGREQLKEMQESGDTIAGGILQGALERMEREALKKRVKTAERAAKKAAKEASAKATKAPLSSELVQEDSQGEDAEEDVAVETSPEVEQSAELPTAEVTPDRQVEVLGNREMADAPVPDQADLTESKTKLDKDMIMLKLEQNRLKQEEISLRMKLLQYQQGSQ